MRKPRREASTMIFKAPRVCNRATATKCDLLKHEALSCVDDIGFVCFLVLRHASLGNFAGDD